MTSPDPRQLVDLFVARVVAGLAHYGDVASPTHDFANCPACLALATANALLSALDALEQAGGGEVGKAESGATASQSLVEKALDEHGWCPPHQKDYLLRAANDALRERDRAIRAAEVMFDAVTWMSGSPSFGPEGEAGKHWVEVRERVFAARKDLELLQDPAKPEPPKDSAVSAPPPSVEALGQEADSDTTAPQSSVAGTGDAVGEAIQWAGAAERRAQMNYDRAVAAEAERDEWRRRWFELAGEDWMCPECYADSPEEHSSDCSLSAFNTKHGEAVLPKSSDRPGSVEALEAERAMVEEIERLQRVLLAAEVGRDQANKERDEAWQAILRIYRTPVYEERGKPASGISVALIRAINDAAALALAGVPGGQLIATDEADTVTEGSVSPGVPGGGRQEQDLGGGAAACSKGGEA